MQDSEDIVQGLLAIMQEFEVILQDFEAILQDFKAILQDFTDKKWLKIAAKKCRFLSNFCPISTNQAGIETQWLRSSEILIRVLKKGLKKVDFKGREKDPFSLTKGKKSRNLTLFKSLFLYASSAPLQNFPFPLLRQILSKGLPDYQSYQNLIHFLAKI